jgi:hypothetical protein
MPDDADVTETVTNPPEELKVEGPAPTATEDAPPSWLTDDSDSQLSQSTTSKVSPEDLTEGAEIFVEGIAYLHDMAAQNTGYDGFLMTPRRTKLWTRSLKFMLKHVKLEKWPELMAVMWLGLDEGLMLMGYMLWRKEQRKRELPSEKKV